MSTALVGRNTEATALDRLQRRKNGESVEAIAKADGISINEVNASLKYAREAVQMEVHAEVMASKASGELVNEKIRRNARKRLGGKFLAGLEKLLDGERVVVSKNKLTGEITLETITDPDVIVEGLKQFRETVSLQERPAAPQTNISISTTQQNNTNHFQATDREDILDRIRRNQQDAKPKTIKATAIEISEAELIPDVPPEPDAPAEDVETIEAPHPETKKDQEETEWTNF